MERDIEKEEERDIEKEEERDIEKEEERDIEKEEENEIEEEEENDIDDESDEEESYDCDFLEMIDGKEYFTNSDGDVILLDEEGYGEYICKIKDWDNYRHNVAAIS